MHGERAGVRAGCGRGRFRERRPGDGGTGRHALVGEPVPYRFREGRAFRQLGDPPHAGAFGCARRGVEEDLGRAQGRARGVVGGHDEARTADGHQRLVPRQGAHRYVSPQRGHVAPAVVEREEEPPGESGGPRAAAQPGVERAQPGAHGPHPVAVEPGERRGDDVADAFVGGRGQQARLRQGPAERVPGGGVEAAQLHVAPRGQVQVPVAVPQGQRAQGLPPPRVEHPAGYPHPREAAVVGEVQAQRTGTGVTTAPGGARRGRRRHGGARKRGGHGGEHTDPPSGEPAPPVPVPPTPAVSGPRPVHLAPRAADRQSLSPSPPAPYPRRATPVL
ncbi:hypothetical protein GA0115257_10329 [Streptomyces sp. LcepLS]|nr:hypothetical protein GA0115257_10329 [Streptomyces sp. LcepLS]